MKLAKDVLILFAALGILAALFLPAVFAIGIARDAGVPPPYSGMLGGAVYGILLYAIAKAAAKKWGA